MVSYIDVGAIQKEGIDVGAIQKEESAPVTSEVRNLCLMGVGR